MDIHNVYTYTRALWSSQPFSELHLCYTPSCWFHQCLSFPPRVTRLPSCHGLVSFLIPWSSPHPLTYHTPSSMHSTISSLPYLVYTPPHQCVQPISMLWPATSSWAAMSKSARKKFLKNKQKGIRRIIRNTHGLHRMAGQRNGEGSVDERWWGGQR